MENEFEKLLGHQEINKQFIEKRTIFLWGEVNDKSSEDIVKKLLYFDSLKTEDIRLFINSPGGSVTAGMAIYDAMQNINSQVSTICMGLAASMGALLLVAGAHGKRFSWPHGRILIHQPMIAGEIIAPASDIKIHAEEMLKTRDVLNKILAHHTGQSLEKIQKDTDRDFFMSAEEAIVYGMIDNVINKLG
ncbi:ATP-dependent Clp protease proteolytic subunit [candidate division KSB1 bacterium]|nr:ATP-dependent Clp protease proteolytic subunit [candidate division KSB1 bacterium]